jgi:hypothetical protein
VFYLSKCKHVVGIIQNQYKRLKMAIEMEKMKNVYFSLEVSLKSRGTGKT